ncbi:MAG: helix-turn-helix domain-containing protein [Oscillospiraceae bacterium]
MKDTDSLQQELMDAPNLDRFLSENQDNFNGGSIHELLNALFQKRSISKAALAKQSGMSEVYLHQVFAGRRSPSRSRLLCLCFGLSATLEETQELLKQCAFAQLYPKNKRDAIIIYGLVNGVSLFDVNDKLFSEGEETLY